jgi:hypothetical protein
VVSLAVLGDDNPRWRPKCFGYSLWDAPISLQFAVIKLLDSAQQWEVLEQSRNPFAAVVLAHLSTRQTQHDPAARCAAKVKLIKGIYERGWPTDRVWRLIRVIDWIMDLPKPLEGNFCHEIKQYEEEKRMPFMTTPERIGREEGRAEGLQKAIEMARERKFGEAGLRLMPEIRAIADATKLEAVFQAIYTAASPEDLRRVWAG